MEREQIVIARHNHAGSPCRGALKDMVVVGITARIHDDVWGDELGHRER